MHSNKKTSSTLITDHEEVQDLLGYSPEKVNKLLRLKRGGEHSNMRTHGLYLAVSHEAVYTLSEQGLHLATATPVEAIIDLERAASEPAQVVKPPLLALAANWDATALLSGEVNNILGDNGRLILPANHLSVPAIVASPETLAYYGAALIKPGDSIRFPDPLYPIWSMTIDDHYVKDFLLSPSGGGFYLEYHQDQPHYHQAICGGGHYLLAKWNAAKTALHITGFQIPAGHAIYTKKGAIHCDAGLTGKYLVGYTTSEDCSTVLLRSQFEEEIVKIHFFNGAGAA